MVKYFNPLNAKLNTICHLLALVGARHILHVSGVRVNDWNLKKYINVTTAMVLRKGGKLKNTESCYTNGQILEAEKEFSCSG